MRHTKINRYRDRLTSNGFLKASIFIVMCSKNMNFMTTRRKFNSCIHD